MIIVRNVLSNKVSMKFVYGYWRKMLMQGYSMRNMVTLQMVLKN